MSLIYEFSEEPVQSLQPKIEAIPNEVQAIENMSREINQEKQAQVIAPTTAPVDLFKEVSFEDLMEFGARPVK
jgi:hypothetical protein